MNKATRALMSDAELELLRATEPKRLEPLDEDQLCELHARVRRARNKYAKLHRRQAGAQVRTERSRGTAAKKNQRTAAKAEVFEDALARVSRQLARAAKQAAAELRAERLAAAEAVKAGGTGGGRRGTSNNRRAAGGSARPERRDDRARRSRTPIEKRTRATTKARGKRDQAKRDSR
ncbi:MAG: hypothetical protein R2726_10610 [Acidimicrobiales bacterium]